MIEVEISHPHSEHGEMSLLTRCVNDVVWPCADGGGSNGDVRVCVLDRIADLELALEVVV